MTASEARLGRVAAAAAALLALGFVYAAFARLWGMGIPCVFHAVTGLWCPGCGVSRACLRLLALDIPGALRANALVVAALPVGIVLAAVRVGRYVRTGSARGGRWEERAWLALAVALLAFGVARNLPWFASLAPH